MPFPLSIDQYLNPYYPRSIIPHFPKPLQRLFGKHKGLNSLNSSWILYLDVLIGSFISILLIEGVFKHSSVFKQHNSPIIIASYGASAILLFNANGAPLSQPRNIIMGHFLSGLVGVILSKLFNLSSGGQDHFYIGGALSVGIASVVMSLFNCVHPPSGASALMPLVDEGIKSMGWWYLPAHLISSVLMVCVACITNNIFRKYPLFWWTSYIKPKPKDEEKQVENSTSVQPSITPEKSGQTLIPAGNNIDGILRNNEDKIEITTNEINLPNELSLTNEELEFLNNFKKKLLNHKHKSTSQ
ncbi:putative membrane protein [Wickerhamomyces ciferrii]|uniref:Membrane protein n=1 Tax=Wickerhamomyces ciferrii (strain ATCC 14091 / BCRC 22168 / CBS 111 / JCM 3599 / NBRC 0793 / NRRL Y-1031 F-60-10) TaxID=1206466 RepID=K0KQM4_WICCF|nr:uncharacterized protein BN7_3115 [Wickerhamomyces ciferrii]CCH43563.1 putative membrane protein [Wickerhamomyces ciferrii]